MPAPIPVLLMVRELNLGGSERQMAEIAKALDRSRFDPRVGCFRPAGLRADDLRAAGVPIVHFPVPWLASVKGALRIAAYVQEQNIRLVHTFDTPANLYGVPAARVAGSAVVLSSQRVDRALWPAVYRHGLRITDRLVDGIVVNCEFLRRHLRVEEKVPPGLIHLCYNGIGSGPCLADLQDRARALDVLPDCVFEPATARVADWLHTIDIFVLPSLSEALSNSLMEAMACGCCVAASRVGGNPELVAHGETGMLFEPRDVAGLAEVLRLLVRDPARRRELASNAARLIRSRFSLEAAARRMGEIYSALLA